jgi:membrane-associated phospholipid phosphatase
LVSVRWIAVICVLIFVGDTCQAQSPYELQKRREWILIGSGAALSIAAIFVVENVDPLTIEEIARLDPDDINAFDRKAIAPYRDTNAGDALMFVSYMLPLTFFAYPDTKHDWKTIGVMWAEVTLINLGLNGVVKGLSTRTRPYVYDPDTPVDEKTAAEARLSFYSGHTSSAAANCFFVAKVFNDYLDSKRAKVAIWTAAAVYPALTGYLRRDSGHHFRTDVMTGYCVGALVGYFVPQLHKIRGKNELTLYPTTVQGTAGVGLCVAF